MVNLNTQRNRSARLEPRTFFVGSLTPEPVLPGTRVAAAPLREGEVPILVKSGREADGVVGGQEALFPERIEVERAADVAVLN